ncbi:MAG TPA: hypothetical protein VLW45_09175, partial [Pelomicrobium sp.]|nr:hypothetical protein [Pelomicrobium sp.]
VDTQTDDDRIGDPVVRLHHPWPAIDTRIPVVYAYLSHARFGGDTLLQLNYVAWFPARPRPAALRRSVPVRALVRAGALSQRKSRHAAGFSGKRRARQWIGGE